MIRIGLIGAADPRHQWFLAAAERRRAGVQIVDFCEPDAALREELAWRYELPGRADHQALLAAAVPSLVAVAQESNAGPAIVDALGHNADVIVAPPVCDTLAELEAIAGLVHESGRRVTAAHTYRGHPASRLAKELIDTDRLGRVEVVALLAAADVDQRELRRATLEGLDLFLWLTGSTSGTISAVTDSHPARKKDRSEISAAFGALTVIATGPNPTGPVEVKFEVRSRSNAAETPQVIQIVGSAGEVEWNVRTGLLRSDLDGADPVTISCGRFDQPADWVLNNFIRRSRPVISTDHSLATTRMLLLAERSWQLGGERQTWCL